MSWWVGGSLRTGSFLFFSLGAAAAAAAHKISTEAERGTVYCFFLLRFCPSHCDASDVYCCCCSWLLLFLSFRLQCFGYGCWLRGYWHGMHAGRIHKGCTPAASATTKGDIYVSGTYTKYPFSFSILWDIPTSAFFHSRAFYFHVNRPHNQMKPSNTTTSGKATGMIVGICTFPRLPCQCTKRHVMLNLPSTGVCNTGTSALYVCNLLLWLTWWWMLLYRTLRNVTSTKMRRKKNIYVVTPRHAAAAAVISAVVLRRVTKEYTRPYSIERTHAPVLHDASQLAYCRYWSSASLPPITSTRYIVLYKVEKRQLWVRPFEWLKLNFASCVVHQTRSHNIVFVG